MSATVQGQDTISASEASVSKEVPDQKSLFSRQGMKFSAKVYGSSLVLTSVAFPIIATVATVCFYLAPSIAFPFLPIYSNWYAPVYGFIFACLICLIFAALRSRFSTASGANTYIYEELMNRHDDLLARLDRAMVDKNEPAAIPDPNAQRDQFTLYHVKALNIAQKNYDKLCEILFKNQAGIEWTLGTGYVNAWHLVHRTQEALVGVGTIEEVIGEVIHDIRAIQKSAISDGKDLIRKMLQAVKDLRPEALVYFDELRADKYYADLFPPHSPVDLGDSNPIEKVSPQAKQSEELAREAIKQVKHALNIYQDSLRRTLVSGRNIIYIATALTAFITYLLLCALILWKSDPSSAGSVVVYYMIGAITGLFVRFYNEANSKNDDAPPDDYGLLLSRLIATPILSGLSAIGGVLVTASLPALSGQGVKNGPELNTIFNGTVSLEYLIAAAIFGYAPNLIVGNLQQRASKYSTDLQSSKGEVSSKDE
jgi:hypothetical protein